MVKIFEMQQQVDKISNHQSRIIEFKSFQDYLQNVNNRSLPVKHNVDIGKKFVDFENQKITFEFLHKLNNQWYTFTHYAQVIEVD